MGLEAESIDIENTDEAKLAELRGDFVEEPKAEEPAPEPEAKAEEAEPEPEPEAKAEEAEPEQRPKNDGIMIPKSRYDAVMGRLKEAEQRLAEQPEATAPAPAAPQEPETTPEDRLAQIDQEIAEAMKEADGEKVAELMRESRAITLDLASQRAAQTSTQVVSSNSAQADYDALVAQVSLAVPESVPGSENYDEGFVVETLEMAEAFEAKGYAPAAALSKALDYTRPGWNAEPSNEAPSTPPPPPEPKATDVEKNLDADKRTPPRMDEGENSDKSGKQGAIDPMRLTDEEFEKLTEAELAKLRGDDF